VKAVHVATALEAAARTDPRIVRIPGFVPVERVAELYRAADAAVLPRGDGGTSGSLILALSLGAPVIAADTPANRELGVVRGAGWLFEPGSRSSLAVALRETAAASPDERAQKGKVARAAAERLDWSAGARTIARTLAGIGG
jgi:glycosyltransferase involved in cell wall biosynthesis